MCDSRDFGHVLITNMYGYKVERNFWVQIDNFSRNLVALKRAVLFLFHEKQEVVFNRRIRTGYVLVSSEHRRHPWL
jgi:hypothetical protein